MADVLRANPTGPGILEGFLDHFFVVELFEGGHEFVGEHFGPLVEL